MTHKVKQILLYTRNTEVHFHLELAKQLRVAYPEVNVKFLTFFSWAAKIAEDEGYNVHYLPHELQNVTDRDISDERFKEIDDQLYYGVGANFNLMLNSERFLPKEKDEANTFGKKHLVVLDNIVSEGTLSISSMYDHFFYWLGGSLANIRSGWHFAFVVCGVPAHRVIALKTPWETWKVTPNEDMQELLSKCISDMDKPVTERIDYMAPHNPKPTYSSRWRSRLDERKCHNYDAKQMDFYFYEKLTLIDFFRSRLPSKWFLKKYPKTHDIDTVRELEMLEYSACYYPLHFEPEATILMYSPWLKNQIEVCRLLSQALPINWKLIVKENPKMIGRRNVTYYQRLSNIPNVLLINPRIPSKDIILNSELTITLAGTASMEARILGKPGIALGHPPFYSMLNLSDISIGLQLANLFKVFQSGSEKLDLQTWSEWVSGTFEAAASYNWHGIYYSLDSSEGNAIQYSNYIRQAIQL
jgi:hypothetical protein